MQVESVPVQIDRQPSERLEGPVNPRGHAIPFAVPCLLLAGAGFGMVALLGLAGGGPLGTMTAGVFGIAFVALCPLMMGGAAFALWLRGLNLRGRRRSLEN